jgi:putative nucleotidyltransferase with HDIG domain
MWKAIKIQQLKSLTRDLPVDLFLRLGEDNYCHVFSRATGLDYRRLLSYRQKGVTELLYRAEDDEVVRKYVRDRQMDTLLQSQMIPPEQKAGVLLNLTEQTAAEVFSQLPMTEEAAQESRGLVTSLVELMIQQPQSLAALLRLVSHGEYLYYHSVAASIFSALLARTSGQYSESDIRTISWGGFLHDLGMSRMEDEWTCDPLAEPGAEFVSRVSEHCRIGMEAIQELSSVPKEVRYMIYQHHETPDGKGLPNGLRAPSLHEPAMLIALVDAWSALISRHPHREPFTPAQALGKLEAETRKGRFMDQHLQWLKAGLFPRLSKDAA